MVDGRHAAGERVRQGLGVDELGEGRGGIEVGHDDGRGHDLARRRARRPGPRPRRRRSVSPWRAGGARRRALEQARTDDRPWCRAHRAPSTSSPYRARPTRRRDTARCPASSRPPEGGVDGEEAQHAPDRRVLDLVGQVAVDDVHHAAEHGDADGLSLRLVGGAVPHLVERPRAAVARRSGRWPGPGPRPTPPPRPCRAPPRSPASRPGARAAARDPSTRRCGGWSPVADAGRLDLRLVDRARPQLEVLEDLVGHRELDRPGQLEAVAADQLGRRGHTSDEVVLLQAQHPHAATRHDRGGGQAVVACSDDDRVVVRHRHGTVATRRSAAAGACPSSRSPVDGRWAREPDRPSQIDWDRPVWPTGQA